MLDAWTALCGDWSDGMLDFATQRARMGTAATPTWAEFGGEEVYALREATIDSPPATLFADWPPYPLGTTYYDLEVEAGDEIALTLAGDPTVEWGLVAVEGSSAATVIGGELTHVAQQDGTLTVGVINLGPLGLDADDPLETAAFELTVARAGGGDPDGEHGPGENGCACRTGDRSGAPGAVWLVLSMVVAIGRGLRRRGR